MENEQVISRACTSGYEVMARSKVKCASTTVTWDFSKLGKVTKNRVIKAIQTGQMTFSYGDAAQIHALVRNVFGIPELTINEGDKRVYWSNLGKSELAKAFLQEGEEVIRVSDVISRLKHGFSPRYRDGALSAGSGYLWYTEGCDVTKLEKLRQELMVLPEFQVAKDKAVKFIEDGNKITFTK